MNSLHYQSPLYLPTERIIDYKYLIKVSQETGISLFSILLTPVQNIKTTFLIETLYLPNAESTELLLEYQILCSKDKVQDVRFKQEYLRFCLSYLNQIEYILSIPLEDLATLVNANDGLDKLVYWRYSLPEPSLITMQNLMKNPSFFNKISYHITDPQIPVDRYPY